jgi:transketolase
MEKRKKNHTDLANAIRFLSADAVEKAQSGHPGMPMGMADVAVVLFRKFLKFDPSFPKWPDRDRLILSAGHGSMLLYALAYLTGYKDMTLNQIKRFRQLGSKTAGHPEYGLASCVETTTGPLGQGIGNAVGMAIAERLLASQYKNKIVNHYTYVIAGDGCLMEGISQEAISLAGHLKLKKLIMLFDDNHISIDGPTSLSTSDNQIARFQASGWSTEKVDGHKPNQIERALKRARKSQKPTLIACRTIIGYGSPNKGGTEATHGAPLGQDEVDATRKKLKWKYKPFIIPPNILKAWRQIGMRGYHVRKKWERDLKKSKYANEFLQQTRGKLSSNWEKELDALKNNFQNESPDWATRKSSQKVLENLTKNIPFLLGGSADLTGSNLTKTDQLKPIEPGKFTGKYIYYGVREHAMAATMNGIALHKGFIPYGGSFLIFTDYCRNAIRLSALMSQQVIYVMTHDSIGLGEDGPTHQPIEQLPSLRAIPNLFVFRPADAVETAECWNLAIKRREGPSLLSLSRQSLPTVRINSPSSNLSSKGGYIISGEYKNPKVVILATGSEVNIALSAQKKLKRLKINTNVVSLPCWELFDQQTESYKEKILGKSNLRVSIEAASPFGWEKYIGGNGIIISMNSFGESAPAKNLYKHFGITAKRIVEKIRKKIR